LFNLGMIKWQAKKIAGSAGCLAGVAEVDIRNWSADRKSPRYRN